MATFLTIWAFSTQYLTSSSHREYDTYNPITKRDTCHLWSYAMLGGSKSHTLSASKGRRTQPCPNTRNQIHGRSIYLVLALDGEFWRQPEKRLWNMLGSSALNKNLGRLWIFNQCWWSGSQHLVKRGQNSFVSVSVIRTLLLLAFLTWGHWD